MLYWTIVVGCCTGALHYGLSAVLGLLFRQLEEMLSYGTPLINYCVWLWYRSGSKLLLLLLLGIGAGWRGSKLLLLILILARDGAGQKLLLVILVRDTDGSCGAVWLMRDTGELWRSLIAVFIWLEKWFWYEWYVDLKICLRLGILATNWQGNWRRIDRRFWRRIDRELPGALDWLCGDFFLNGRECGGGEHLL